MPNTNFLQEILLISSSLEALSIFFAEIIGYIGVCIMAYGAVMGASHFILDRIRKENHLPQIRIDLGKHLALGLEFLVGKDIIESIIRPSWDDLGKLAAIIALRTAVSFVLQWELRELKKEIAEEKGQRKKK